MTDQELIAKLQGLKNIKPSQDWVVLSKNHILSAILVAEKQPVYKSIFSNISSLFYQKKLVYSFAVLLFLITAGVTFFEFGLSGQHENLAGQSTASSLAESALKSNVADLKSKSQSLANAVQNNSENVSLVIEEVKDATKNLKVAIQKNPGLVKIIALDVNNSKSLLDIAGGSDLKATSDDLYKTIDDQMIADLKKTTLTKDQQGALNHIQDLYSQGKYSDALVNILLIGNTNQ